ncbi:MAG: DUF433 domain-containing protein [Saprospiraceae bacterium]|jgi:uncharacterized protein (DUF433 family)|nr:DUF433 domain-containing protein [Saprospiraceae bacterium]
MPASTALQKAEAILTELTEQETEILLQRIFDKRKPSNRGISKTPGVCGGRACIDGTRMPVWSLVYSKFLGLSEFEIVYRFPTMTIKDLKNAWEYYLQNKAEIEFDIHENTADDEDDE